MGRKKTWELLQKLENFQAIALAKKINDLSTAAETAQKQHQNLINARQSYVPTPQQQIPIGLLKNQRAFLFKLDSTLEGLKKNMAQINIEKQAAISAWRRAQGRADGFDELEMLSKQNHQTQLLASEQKSIEEISTSSQIAAENLDNHTRPTPPTKH